MTRDYHCITCGKRMKPTVLWQCVDDNDALQRGETITVDHHHTPDTQPGDGVAFVLHGPIPHGMPRPFVEGMEDDD